MGGCSNTHTSAEKHELYTVVNTIDSKCYTYHVRWIPLVTGYDKIKILDLFWRSFKYINIFTG